MNRKFLRLALAACAASAAFAALPSRAFPLGSFPITIEEYVSDDTGHYFLVGPDEKEVVDSGVVGRWRPTGYRIGAYDRAYYSVGYPNVPVCRFYAPGPNTHFFTASSFECRLLLDHPEWGWISEGAHFNVHTAQNGVCRPDQAPVHRFYNGRAEFNDSNHRYVADGAVLNVMRERGWIDEGVAWCTEDARYIPPPQ
jgi:hypothetical protein